MNNQQQIVVLLKELSGQANILTIPRFYLSLLDGDINAALLLNQIVYWSDRSNRTDGFFYKTYDEWERETSLTQYQVARAVKKLKKIGILETKIKRANGAPTVHYKLNFELLTNSIIKKLDNPLSRNLIMDYQETSQSLTETRTETTTEINCEPNGSREKKPKTPKYKPPELPETNPVFLKYPILKRMKQANRDLLFAFFENTGIKPIDKDYKLYLKTTYEMIERGIMPDTVKKSIQKMRQDRLVISGPQSIMKVAISILAEGNGGRWSQEEYESNKAKKQEEWKKLKAEHKAKLEQKAREANAEHS